MRPDAASAGLGVSPSTHVINSEEFGPRRPIHVLPPTSDTNLVPFVSFLDGKPSALLLKGEGARSLRRSPVEVDGGSRQRRPD